MSKESRVAGTDYVRVTTDDGRLSYGYHEGLLGERSPDEIAYHHQDGTTDAYEVDTNPLNIVTGDFRGKQKNR
jgi:hypothetical protein